jgi:hypothetical protein
VALENRPDQRIMARAPIECTHQPLDHRCVDTGTLNDAGDDQAAPFRALVTVRAHNLPFERSFF